MLGSRTGRSLAALSETVLLAASFVATDRIGKSLPVLSGNVTAAWPAAGVALAALLLLGVKRSCPGILLGALVGSLWAFLDTASIASATTTVAVGAAVAAGSLLQALAGFAILGRLPGSSSFLGGPAGQIAHLESPGRVLRFAAATLGICLVGATIGSVSLRAGGLIATAEWGGVWGTWYLGSVVGILVVTPLALAWLGSAGRRRPIHRPAEAVAVLLAVTGLALWHDPRHAWGSEYIEILALPALAWGAFRLDARFVTLSILVFAVTAVWAASRTHGALDGALASVEGLRFFYRIGVIAAAVLLIRSAVAEGRAARHLSQFSVDHTPDSMFWVGPDARIVNVNDPACEALEYSRRELLGLGVPDFDPKMSMELWRDRWAVFAAKGALRFQTTHRTKSGRTFPVEISAHHVEVEGRELICASAHDISGRLAAEEEIRRSARELRTLNRIREVFLTVPDEEMYVRVLEIVLEVMRSQYGIVGYIDEKGDLVVPSMTRHIWSECSVKDKSIVFRREQWGCGTWPTAIRTRKTSFTNEPSRNVPEGHIPIRRHVTVPLLHREEVVGLLLVANKESDYSEEDVRLLETVGRAVAPVLDARNRRARAEADSRERDRMFRHTFEQAAVGMAHVAPDGRWLRVNRRLADIVGYEFVELQATSLQALTHPDDLSGDLGFARQVLLGETGTGSLEKRLVRKDGSSVWVSLTMALVRNSAGEPEYYIFVVEDISARKAGEEQILRHREQLEELVHERTKELEAFTYSVSHDLRGPLRAIDGFSRMVIEDYGDKLDDEGRRLLAVVRDSTQEMGRLIDALLALSRLGRTDLRQTPVDMVELTERVVARVTRDVAPRSIEFRIGDLPPARGDEDMLRQVIANLVENATKFTRKIADPVVTIAGERRDGELHYSVRDNGAGFDMRFVEKLFGVFQRLHGKEQFEGTGIGLATVKRVVERHGGRVWAEGVLDEGATFHFALPHLQGALT